jgi:glycosyltransferase involved in cell wall biosynthesis
MNSVNAKEKILVVDVHASESGALSILVDFHHQIYSSVQADVEWVFVVSTPKLEGGENVKVARFPWIKKSWLHRVFFDLIVLPKLIKRLNPQKIVSLQNKGVSGVKIPQLVYLHLPFVLCDYQFKINKDGVKLWFYQNIFSFLVFRSLSNVNQIVVQTSWMKEALSRMAHIQTNKIKVISPNILNNNIIKTHKNKINRKELFYPATPFLYKNHLIILKAIKEIQSKSSEKFKVIFTLKSNQNQYTKQLAMYAIKNSIKVDFIGSINRNEIFQRYSNSVLIFPSLVESFGMPLLEARMSNTFVLSGDTSFSKEILKGYKNNLMFDGYDKNDLAEKILKIQTMEYSSSDNNFDHSKPLLIDLIKEFKKI